MNLQDAPNISSKRLQYAHQNNFCVLKVARRSWFTVYCPPLLLADSLQTGGWVMSKWCGSMRAGGDNELWICLTDILCYSCSRRYKHTRTLSLATLDTKCQYHHQHGDPYYIHALRLRSHTQFVQYANYITDFNYDVTHRISDYSHES